MALPDNLTQVSPFGVDVSGTLNAAEGYYGQISQAVNSGYGLQNILERTNISGDAYGVASAGMWLLQNVPLPGVIGKIEQVAVQIGSTASAGASVGAMFVGVGAVFGAAVGAVIGAIESLSGLFGAHAGPPQPDTFDYLRSVVPVVAAGNLLNAVTGVEITGMPLDPILHAKMWDVQNAALDPGQIGKLANDFGGNTSIAQKIMAQYKTLYTIDKLNVPSQQDLFNRSSEANNGFIAPDLRNETALAAIYMVQGDKHGKTWAMLDYMQYLLLLRRGYEYILEGQRHGVIDSSHISPDWAALSFLIASTADQLPGGLKGPKPSAPAPLRDLAGWIAYYLHGRSP